MAIRFQAKKTWDGCFPTNTTIGWYIISWKDPYRSKAKAIKDWDIKDTLQKNLHGNGKSSFVGRRYIFKWCFFHHRNLDGSPRCYHKWCSECIPCVPTFTMHLYISAIHMCWGLNSHCFHRIGDDHQPNSMVYIPNSRVYVGFIYPI